MIGFSGGAIFDEDGFFHGIISYNDPDPDNQGTRSVFIPVYFGTFPQTFEASRQLRAFDGMNE